MKWSEEQRQEFITNFLNENGYINRSDICRKFKISVPQASLDMGRWKKDNPDKIFYNVRTRRYEIVQS